MMLQVLTPCACALSAHLLAQSHRVLDQLVCSAKGREPSYHNGNSRKEIDALQTIGQDGYRGQTGIEGNIGKSIDRMGLTGKLLVQIEVPQYRLYEQYEKNRTSLDLRYRTL